MTKERLLFAPLGGAGEIGMNLNVYGFGPEGSEEWIAVDMGVVFGRESATPGIDLIMADPSFLEERRERCLGIVLTHGHEDHIGALPHLWPRLKCPLYATPFTASLIKDKFMQAGLGDSIPLRRVDMGGRIELGPFDIEFLALTHSIPEPNALVIRTPIGTVLHTGDWKIDADPLIGAPVEEKRLRALGDEGVMAMVCDSTNVFVEGEAGSEGGVRESLVELVKECKSRVFITSFASNVARLESVAHAAREAGRKCVLVGRAMRRITAAAEANGFLKGLPPFLSENAGQNIPRDQVLFLCTGSQGEERAALNRIARGAHPAIRAEAGDTIIFSSREIPGNETTIGALHNAFVALGVRIITTREAHVHVSGHPCRDELARMYDWVRPETSIPVHGEMRHLRAHVDFAKDVQIQNALLTPNGTLVELAPNKSRIIGEVPNGRLYLDGDVLTDDGPRGSAIGKRQELAEAGSISIALVLDEKGELLADPDVLLFGVPEYGTSAKEMGAVVVDAIEETLASLSPRECRDDHILWQKVRRGVRHACRDNWGKRPVLHIHITRLD